MVRNWKSVLSPKVNPYINRSAFVRRLFYRRIADLLALAGSQRAQHVLEVGCWEGYALPSLLKRYGEVWAIDDDSSSLSGNIAEMSSILVAARNLCGAELRGRLQLHLVKADAQLAPVPSGMFDLIFCIDTLPYIRPDRKAQVLQECRRMLKPDGKILLSLPIELGPILMVRELARRWSGSWRDHYSLTDFLMAACFKPKPASAFDKEQNLRGYDYRDDVKSIASVMRIDKIRYSPLNSLGCLNPFILLRCKP